MNRDREIKLQIQAIYTQRKGIYGYRRIKEELLRQYNRRVNHKKVLKIMQGLGIKAIIQRKRAYRNTYHIAEATGRVPEICYNVTLLQINQIRSGSPIPLNFV